MFKFLPKELLCALVYCGLAAPVFSSPFYIVQKDILYLQNSSAAPTASNGFDAVLNVTTPGAFDGGTVATPGPAGIETLSPAAGPALQFRSGLTASSNFPTGNYTFNLTDSANPANTASQVVDDNVETFPSPIPALTPASWDALQIIDPSMLFTFHFNSFASSFSPLTFFAIQNLTDFSTPVFDGLQPGVTQDTVAANTLQNGTPYRFLIFFTNNVVGTNTQLQLTHRTQGLFTPGAATSAPEPASISLCLVGAILFIAAARRKHA